MKSCQPFMKPLQLQHQQVKHKFLCGNIFLLQMNHGYCNYSSWGEQAHRCLILCCLSRQSQWRPWFHRQQCQSSHYCKYSVCVSYRAYEIFSTHCVQVGIPFPSIKNKQVIVIIVCEQGLDYFLCGCVCFCSVVIVCIDWTEEGIQQWAYSKAWPSTWQGLVWDPGLPSSQPGSGKMHQTQVSTPLIMETWL